MIGAIIGDICGSVYEFNNPKHEEDVKLFTEKCQITDDTIMTCANAEWLLSGDFSRENLVDIMKKWGTSYSQVGYGPMFKKWLQGDSTEDYGSFGNGSAMRISPIGFYANSINECKELALISAKTTHGHEEGIKGAQAIACAIYMARHGLTKQEIKDYIEREFKYNLNRELDELGRNVHKFDATCQVTVPEAIICFLKSNDFEDCIKKSIKIGGDTDTIAAMAGGIAEAYYGIPSCFIEWAKLYLDKDILELYGEFNKEVSSHKSIFEDN